MKTAHMNTPPCANTNGNGCYRRQRAVTVRKPTAKLQKTTSSGSRCQVVQTPPISTLDVRRLKKELEVIDYSKFSFRPTRPTHDEDEFDRPQVPSFLSSPSRKSCFGNFPFDDDQTEELRGLDFVGDHDVDDDDDDSNSNNIDDECASMRSPSMD